MLQEENILKLFNEDFTGRSMDYPGAVYIILFHEYAPGYRIYYNKKNKLYCGTSTESFRTNIDVKTQIDDRKFIKQLLKLSETDKNLHVIQFTLSEFIVAYDDTVNRFMSIIYLDDAPESSDYSVTLFTNNIDFSFNYLKKYISKSPKKSKVEFGITAVDVSGCLYTSYYDYDEHLIDIKANYNDDIPYDKMCHLIESKDKPELMLFYGEPGTGKTSLIKHFITKYTDMNFVFMDGALLANVGQEKLMSYFLENQNTIFILEDCEKVLMNRDHYVNPVMPLLLNLTDGIIGEVLGIKLICTFNTSLNNIDKALLRKGRLSLKYEFKKLAAEKVKKILKDENAKDMNLADIYYISDENDFSKKSSRTVGFG